MIVSDRLRQMSWDSAARLAALAGLATLDDPVRRRLYEYVSGQDQPVSREDAAAGAGIGRALTERGDERELFGAGR